MTGLPDTAETVLRGIALGTVALGLIVALVRIIGLRSFSKMTAFDFVITLATGSLLATAATAKEWTDYLQALVAVATLMALQVALAVTRRLSGGSKSVLENEPVILMRDGRFIEQAMAATRVSRDDVMAKLREANVTEMGKVRAVVLETTGDISVLHGERLDDTLLSGVREGTSA
ncbi:MAG: YetF domain-containing protein [Oricola sp.]